MWACLQSSHRTKECDCESLASFMLLARQVNSVPKWQDFARATPVVYCLHHPPDWMLKIAINLLFTWGKGLMLKPASHTGDAVALSWQNYHYIHSLVFRQRDIPVSLWILPIWELHSGQEEAKKNHPCHKILEGHEVAMPTKMRQMSVGHSHTKNIQIWNLSLINY